MGTETRNHLQLLRMCYMEYVKLNNPLMGTETTINVPNQ